MENDLLNELFLGPDEHDAFLHDLRWYHKLLEVLDFNTSESTSWLRWFLLHFLLELFKASLLQNFLGFGCDLGWDI